MSMFAMYVYLFICCQFPSFPLTQEARKKLFLFSSRGGETVTGHGCETQDAPSPSRTLKRVMRERRRMESESDFKVGAGIDGSIDGICTPG